MLFCPSVGFLVNSNVHVNEIKMSTAQYYAVREDMQLTKESYQELHTSIGCQFIPHRKALPWRTAHARHCYIDGLGQDNATRGRHASSSRSVSLQ